MNIPTVEEYETQLKNLRDLLKKSKCEVENCENLIDMTDHVINTTCTYHKYLFIWWTFRMDWNHLEKNKGKDTPFYRMNQEYRRKEFANWMDEIGKEECDRLVAKMEYNRKSWEKKDKGGKHCPFCGRKITVGWMGYDSCCGKLFEFEDDLIKISDAPPKKWREGFEPKD